MNFSEFLNEASSKSEATTISRFERKIVDLIDSANGDEAKERKAGAALYKEIYKKYDESSYMFETLYDLIINKLEKSNSWAAIEGASEYFESIGDKKRADDFQSYADKIDKSKDTETGSAATEKRTIDAIKTKSADIKYCVDERVRDDLDIQFTGKKGSTISVKESVKVAAANLYFQHKTKYFKKIETNTSKAVLIVNVGDNKAGQIVHAIYDDNGTTKITSYDALTLVDDALDGTFNNKTITEI